MPILNLPDTIEIPFESLTNEQRELIHTVMTGTGLQNPLSSKIDSAIEHCDREISIIESFGNECMVSDQQKQDIVYLLGLLKFNLDIFKKHTNEISGSNINSIDVFFQRLSTAGTYTNIMKSITGLNKERYSFVFHSLMGAGDDCLDRILREFSGDCLPGGTVCGNISSRSGILGLSTGICNRPDVAISVISCFINSLIDCIQDAIDADNLHYCQAQSIIENYQASRRIADDAISDPIIGHIIDSMFATPQLKEALINIRNSEEDALQQTAVFFPEFGFTRRELVSGGDTCGCCEPNWIDVLVDITPDCLGTPVIVVGPPGPTGDPGVDAPPGVTGPPGAPGLTGCCLPDQDCWDEAEFGACCVSGYCLEVTDNQCFFYGGLFAGDYTTCAETIELCLQDNSMVCGNDAQCAEGLYCCGGYCTLPCEHSHCSICPPCSTFDDCTEGCGGQPPCDVQYPGEPGIICCNGYCRPQCLSGGCPDCQGGCCDYPYVCCGGSQCCNPNDCCNGQCCPPTYTCCEGGCCDGNCCSDGTCCEFECCGDTCCGQDAPCCFNGSCVPLCDDFTCPDSETNPCNFGCGCEDNTQICCGINCEDPCIFNDGSECLNDGTDVHCPNAGGVTSDVNPINGCHDFNLNNNGCGCPDGYKDCGLGCCPELYCCQEDGDCLPPCNGGGCPCENDNCCTGECCAEQNEVEPFGCCDGEYNTCCPGAPGNCCEGELNTCRDGHCCDADQSGDPPYYAWCDGRCEGTSDPCTSDGNCEPGVSCVGGRCEQLCQNEEWVGDDEWYCPDSCITLGPSGGGADGGMNRCCELQCITGTGVCATCCSGMTGVIDQFEVGDQYEDYNGGSCCPPNYNCNQKEMGGILCCPSDKVGSKAGNRCCEPNDLCCIDYECRCGHAGQGAVCCWDDITPLGTGQTPKGDPGIGDIARCLGHCYNPVCETDDNGNPPPEDCPSNTSTVSGICCQCTTGGEGAQSPCGENKEFCVDSKGNGSCCKEGQICCDGICREYSENGSCCYSHLTDKYYYCETGCCDGLDSNGAVVCIPTSTDTPLESTLDLDLILLTLPDAIPIDAPVGQWHLTWFLWFIDTGVPYVVQVNEADPLESLDWVHLGFPEYVRIAWDWLVVQFGYQWDINTLNAILAMWGTGGIVGEDIPPSIAPNAEPIASTIINGGTLGITRKPLHQNACPPSYGYSLTPAKDVKQYNRTYGAILQKDVSYSIEVEKTFDDMGRLISYQVNTTEKSLLTPEEECVENPNTHWMPRTSNRVGYCMQGATHGTQTTSTTTSSGYGSTTSSGYGSTKPVVGGQDELSTDIPLSTPCADHINVMPVEFQIINFVADDGLKTDERVVTNQSDSKSKISKAEKISTPQLGVAGYSPPNATNTTIKGSVKATIQSDGNMGEAPLITFVSGSNIRLDTNDKASFVRISVDDLNLYELVDVDDDTVKEPSDDDILYWDNNAKLWKARQQMGTTGNIGPLGGSNYEILFNATGGASGNSNLTYNYNTNTFGTTADVYFYSGFTAGSMCSFDDNVVQGAKLKDYSEVVTAHSITSGNLTLDIEDGNVHTVSIDALISPTLAFSNPIASGDASSLTLFITDGATSGGITWPTSVKWSGGTAPSLSASGTDVVSFTTIDGGTAWYGFVGGIGFS